MKGACLRKFVALFASTKRISYQICHHFAINHLHCFPDSFQMQCNAIHKCNEHFQYWIGGILYISNPRSFYRLNFTMKNLHWRYPDHHRVCVIWIAGATLSVLFIYLFISYFYYFIYKSSDLVVFILKSIVFIRK